MPSVLQTAFGSFPADPALPTCFGGFWPHDRTAVPRTCQFGDVASRLRLH